MMESLIFTKKVAVIFVLVFLFTTPSFATIGVDYMFSGSYSSSVKQGSSTVELDGDGISGFGAYVFLFGLNLGIGIDKIEIKGKGKNANKLTHDGIFYGLLYRLPIPFVALDLGYMIGNTEAKLDVAGVITKKSGDGTGFLVRAGLPIFGPFGMNISYRKLTINDMKVHQNFVIKSTEVAVYGVGLDFGF